MESYTELKKIYDIWKDSGFRDKDIERAFDRAITRQAGISLLEEADANARNSATIKDGVLCIEQCFDLDGDIDLAGLEITSLPEGLTVGGNLILRGTNTTTLPDGLKVGGDLDLRGVNIKSLPDGLKVGSYLDLRYCSSLTSLPEGLTVGGGLYLYGCSNITSLPDSLTVGGKIYKDF